MKDKVAAERILDGLVEAGIAHLFGFPGGDQTASCMADMYRPAVIDCVIESLESMRQAIYSPLATEAARRPAGAMMKVDISPYCQTAKRASIGFGREVGSENLQ